MEVVTEVAGTLLAGHTLNKADHACTATTDRDSVRDHLKQSFP